MKWRLASFCPLKQTIVIAHTCLYQRRIENLLGKMITEGSGGRLSVKVFGANEIVPAFEALDAVSNGTVEMGHGAPYYWKGKVAATQFLASVPFGMTAQEVNAWYQWGNGQKLADNIYKQMGAKFFPSGNTGVQMGGWFNKEINSADDLKGLKMRIPGLGGDVMAKLGASPVSLPGGQIYENLVSGAIEATEWVGPWNDYAMKFYEAAKYYYFPGMHEPGGYNAFGFNKSWWESLSRTDQMIIEACGAQANDLAMSEYNANNGAFLQKLVNEHGVVVKEFNDDVYDAFGKGAEEVFAETVAHSDLARRVHESFVAARTAVGGWMKLSEGGYYAQRNRVLGL